VVYFQTLGNKKYAAYAIGLPNDLTCWQFPKGTSLLPSEALHIAFITARSRGNDNDIYVSAEWERILLEKPEQHERLIKRRLAALERKLKKGEIH